jgi:hypothetical protein
MDEASRVARRGVEAAEDGIESQAGRVLKVAMPWLVEYPVKL